MHWEEEKPEDAWLQCPHCESHLTDADRVSMIRAGEWRPTAPFNGKRGYFLNGIYSPFRAKKGFKSRLHQMVSDFLEAKHGGPERLKTWTNTFLAETWEEAGERVEPGELAKRAEDYGPQNMPVGVVMVTGGADVQKDRIEIEWVGIGLDEESWGVATDIVYGDTEKLEVWKELSQKVERTFKRADGLEMRPIQLALDIHYRPKQARTWCRNHGTRCKVVPVFGVGSAQPTMVCDRFNKHYNQRVWSVATDHAKDIIYARLKIQEPGARFMHFPKAHGYTEAFYKQLTAEKVVTRYTKGFPKRIYEKDAGARNEALDRRVYWIAGLEILKPNLPAISKSLGGKPMKEYQLKPAPEPEKVEPEPDSPPSSLTEIFTQPKPVKRQERPERKSLDLSLFRI